MYFIALALILCYNFFSKFSQRRFFDVLHPLIILVTGFTPSRKATRMESTAVWERDGYGHTMSKNLFALLLCFWTAFGIATSAATASFTQNMGLNLPLLIGTFVVAMIGVVVAMKSKNPIVSFIGYMMITISFGAMVGPVVALYTAASVAKVFIITTSMVVVLGVVGAVIPDSLEGWGGPLLAALTILVIGQFFTAFATFFGLPVEGALTLLDWVGVVLFSAYVVFDLNRAMRIERTHDNAIDCAVAVYLDFANLFLRLLELLGKARSDD